MTKTDIKSTYSLDVESVRMLEALARHWKVSKSEALRRAIRIAAGSDCESHETAVDALERLQSRVRERQVDLSAWEHAVKAERHAIL